MVIDFPYISLYLSVYIQVHYTYLNFCVKIEIIIVHTLYASFLLSASDVSFRGLLYVLKT